MIISQVVINFPQIEDKFFINYEKKLALIMLESLNNLESDQITEEVLQKLAIFLEKSKQIKKINVIDWNEILLNILKSDKLVNKIKGHQQLVMQLSKINQFIFQNQIEKNDLELSIDLNNFNQIINNNQYTNKIFIQFLIDYIQNSDQEINMADRIKILETLRIEDCNLILIEYLVENIEIQELSCQNQIKLLKICMQNNFVNINLINLEQYLIQLLQNDCEQNLSDLNNYLNNYIQYNKQNRILKENQFNDVQQFLDLIQYFKKIVSFREIQNLDDNQIQNIIKTKICFLMNDQDDEKLYDINNLIYYYLSEFNIENQDKDAIFKFLCEKFEIQNSLNQFQLNLPISQLILNILKVDEKFIYQNLICNYLKNQLDLDKETINIKYNISNNLLIQLYQIHTIMKQTPEIDKNFVIQLSKYIQQNLQYKLMDESIIKDCNDISSFLFINDIILKYGDSFTINSFNKQFINSHVFNKILKNLNIYDIQKTMENIIEKPFILNIILPKVSQLLESKHQQSKINLDQVYYLSKIFQQYKQQFTNNFVNDHNVTNFLHYYYHIFSIIEDSLFFVILRNYDEFKERIQVNLMDPEAYKQDIEKNKDKIMEIQLLENDQLNKIIDIYEILSDINIASNKIHKAMYLTICQYYDKIDIDKLSNYIFIMGDIDLNDKDQNFDKTIQQYIQENISQIQGKQAIKILWYLTVKYSLNAKLYEQLISKITNDCYYQMENTKQFILPLIIKTALQIEQPYIQYDIDQKIIDQMKQALDSNHFYQRSSEFKNFIDNFLKKFGYKFQKNQNFLIFKFPYLFNNTDYGIILDRSCYRGRSKEEIGIISIIRRIMKREKKKIRIFEFYDWKKLERRHMKYSFLKSKMKNLPQDDEAKKRKFYYNED